jgi:hypothetical protein
MATNVIDITRKYAFVMIFQSASASSNESDLPLVCTNATPKAPLRPPMIIIAGFKFQKDSLSTQNNSHDLKLLKLHLEGRHLHWELDNRNLFLLLLVG